MSNIIDSIQVSGVTYTIQGSGGGGNPTVELTQAEYDALVESGAVQTNTYYIITDAQAGDLTQYWTSAQTSSAITEATSGKASQSDLETVSGAVAGKQDQLISGTNIKTINNESILGSGNIDIQGGGGKAVSGGTNISITTGETADTINCTLPIKTNAWNSLTFNTSRNPSQVLYASAFGDYTTASGKGSFAIGKDTTASGEYSFVGGYNSSQAKGSKSFSFGDGTVTNGIASVAFGQTVTTNNHFEFSCGQYNNSVSATTTFGDSGNTLFSVGNGTANNARHNAFEIRQNGDIYLSLNGQDVKLQDQLGGGGSITIDPSLNSGSTNAVANSAITTAINDRQLKKEYVASETVFSSTDTVYGRAIYHPVFRCYSNNSTNTELVLNNKDLGLYFPTVNGKKIFSSNKYETDWLGDVIEASAITTSITSGSTDAQVPSAKAVNDKLGGLSVVKLTESEYTALVTKDSDTLYVVIPDPSN